LTKRQQIMFNFREILNANKEELAAIVTEEHGKTLPDALGEVTRGLEVVEFATGMANLLKGSYSESVSTSIDVYSIKQPLGVVGIISPFNFPAMVPMWFFPVAIAAGNTVVLKPSEKNPSAAIWIAEQLKAAGLPDGVFNVLQGDKVAVDALLTSADVQAISFVGSTPIAKYVYETGTAHGKRVQALGGAKNHMLVLPDADLDLVADSAINAGFGSAGERCMAISVVVAVEPIADELVTKIAARMKELKVGDGRRNCDMGPLITAEHRDKVAGYIDIALADKATVVVDGRGISVDGDSNGFWLGPTLIDNVSTSSKVYQDEIFGPVLPVKTYKTVQEAIGYVNAHDRPLGLYYFGDDAAERELRGGFHVRDALERGREADVVLHGHVRVDRRHFWRIAEHRLHLPRLVRDVDAADLGGAGRRSERAGDDAHRRALAGTVRAQEAHDFAARHVEREVLDGDHRAVSFR
jgi:malonate-semialdehyde dehydrogenase (acetylating)/methylmalonate-semialdehyde dehydrogenase